MSRTRILRHKLLGDTGTDLCLFLKILCLGPQTSMIQLFPLPTPLFSVSQCQLMLLRYSWGQFHGKAVSRGVWSSVAVVAEGPSSGCISL